MREDDTYYVALTLGWSVCLISPIKEFFVYADKTYLSGLAGEGYDLVLYYKDEDDTGIADLRE